MEKTTIQEALPKIQAILQSGQSCRLVVTGSSMLPFLRHKKDAVILAPYQGNAKRGDILFYARAPQVCVLHRVQKVLKDGTLLFCGDAQTALEPVKPEQIIAAVPQIERDGKTVDCSRLSLRTAVWLWQVLLPVRPYLLAGMRKLHFLKN